MVMFTYKPGSRIKVEEGDYLGEVSSLNENIPGKWGTCVRIVFRIVGGEFDGATASVLAKDDWSAGSKLDMILRSLGVEPLEYGQEFDSNLLIGRQAKIYVESEEKNGQVHNNVTKWRPLKNPITSTQTAVTPPAAPSVVNQTIPVPPTKSQVPVAPQPVIAPTTGVREVVEPKPSPTGVVTVNEIEW